MSNKKWEKCVIVGAGISGLINSHALSKYFEKVHLYEKDQIDEKQIEPRWGVPQGEHIHIVLTAAVKSLDKRFPNLLSKLQNIGSNKYSVTEGLKWYHHGNWKKQYTSDNDFTTFTQTRPVLETTIREEVTNTSNIEIIDQSKFIDYIYNAEDNSISGIKIERNGETEEILADLVVDAMGRSSKSTRYFDNHDIKLPDIETIDVNIKYVSCFYPADGIAENPLQSVYPHPPETSKYGVIGNVEGDKVIVTLMGFDGDHPSTDLSEFLEFAKQLDHPFIYNKLKESDPITPLRSYAYPKMRRIYYHQMKQLPSNFIAVGDAVCHFDPLFGQGMTVSTLEADILEDLLEQAKHDQIVNINKKYFGKINSLISNVWDIVVAEDTRFEIGHKPTLKQKLYKLYTNQIYELYDDEYVLDRFYKVINLEEPPTHLLHPKVILKILKNKIFG